MTEKAKINIILASKSIGRKKLLDQINLSYNAIPANIIEDHPKNMSISAIVKYLAEKKAIHISKTHTDAYIIGADSLCCIGDTIIGKPQNAEQAFKILKKLQGNTHYLYSGLALVVPNTTKIYTDYDKTAVTFSKMDNTEINKYLDLFDTSKFAAGYQLEGLSSLFIKKIDGCPSNVIGLSLPKLFQLFKKANINLLNYVNLKRSQEK